MKKITSIIFDMDGLLIDTETPCKTAWNSTAAQFGKTIDDEVLSGLIGRHVDDFIAIVGEYLDLDLRESGFMERYDDIYLSNFMRNGIEVMRGVSSLLNFLSENHVPRAVVTSSEKKLAPRKLRLADLDQY
ncbi:MAG: HAD family phosphatase, partial [Verrucomicrobiales bacterium]|nr:HAD family phosphatase [Verrucomicrobiales bacterium]